MFPDKIITSKGPSQEAIGVPFLQPSLYPRRPFLGWRQGLIFVLLNEAMGA
jgi:hypothetical protein